MKRLTLEEIGKLAGVSRSTVSRVINNHPKISAEAKAAVERVIAETGFVPNSAARSLASSQTRILGLIIPSVVQTTFSDSYYAPLVQGITHACHEHNYTIALYLFNTRAQEKETIKRIFSGQMADGLIITTDTAYDLYGDLIKNHPLPLLQIGSNQKSQNDSISYVDVDNVAGGYLATSHLIQQGNTRIAQIAVTTNSAGINRDIGYRQALAAMEIDFDENLVVTGDFNQESGYEAMKQLLEHKPDAVFAQSDKMAMGAICAIQDAGLRVPEDIAVVGFDDIPEATTFDVPLTTIRQPVYRQGIVLIETLIDIIKTQPDPTRRVILPVELVIRASSGAIH